MGAADSVELLPREGYLEARHRGAYSQAAYREFIVRSIQACVEQRLDLLLVDISELTDFRPTATERYEMGILGSSAAMSLTRVAVFGTPEQVHGGFATLVARNRGLDVRSFTDRDEALRWLREGNPAAPSR